jgi:integral membrane sensor domain MASE1
LSERAQLPSITFLVVVGSLAFVGALLSTLLLIFSDPSEDAAQAVYAGGLGLAVAAMTLVARMIEQRRSTLLETRMRALG